MYQKNYYNPRKWNTASTLSGCIQRDLSKVIISYQRVLLILKLLRKLWLTGLVV